MKLFYAFSLLALLSSCGPKYKSIQGKIEYIDFPQIGRSSTVNIGDSLLSKAKVETRDGLRLNNSVSGSFGLYNVNFYSGDYYIRSETKDSKQYASVDPKKVTWDSGESNSDCFLNVRNYDDKVSGMTLGGVNISIKPTPSITKKTVTLVNSTNFKQELIYNGKSGNIARFLYREYSGTLARPAFSQELTYDLSESTTIGFKKVRIEVLGTTNTSITYKVISGFEM
jgi:hypothetical protein